MFTSYCYSLDKYGVVTVVLSTPQHPNEQKILDLLWRYYEKTKNYSAAARVLSKLAEKEGLVLHFHFVE